MIPGRDELEAAAKLVHSLLAPTPQIRWALLCERCGADVWVKHENHTPIGAFKLRGGLVYLNNSNRDGIGPGGVITATRGNHGQSIAWAARHYGLRATIVVPHGNSAEKNASMRALGADLIEHGQDFQEAREYTEVIAAERGIHIVPPYHPMLVSGVASYGLEFLGALPQLDTVYVPIGLGSGISGMIAAREALGLRTRIVGVVAEHAPAYALSFEASKPIPTASADTIADGVACRVPHPEAVAVINRWAERVVTVSEEEIKDAMRCYFVDTHNVAEGAGAIALAALLKERERIAGKCAGVVLSGSNVDRLLFSSILASD